MPNLNPSGSEPATPNPVLIVEDNPDGREALVELLSLWNFDVRAAEDGREGLEMALQEPPAVAIIDIGLPKMDGYEVARRLRQGLNGHAPHLIALTGYGRPEDRKRALEAGFDLHLVKPVQPTKLHDILLEGNSSSMR